MLYINELHDWVVSAGYSKDFQLWPGGIECGVYGHSSSIVGWVTILHSTHLGEIQCGECHTFLKMDVHVMC